MKPLCVDLDGTFIKTDSLWEAIILVLKREPWKLLIAFGYIFQKARFKEYIANLITLDWNSIPVNEEVLEYCKQQKEQGRVLYIVTGAHQSLLSGFLKVYPMFKAVICTSSHINLTGKHKARKLTDDFGQQGFDYIGNSPVDIPVWMVSDKAYYAGHSHGLEKSISNLDQRFSGQNFSILKIIKMIRVHQWSKSALIFLPIILAHRIGEIDLWTQALEAFITFSFIASSIYIFNDLLDLESDRYNSKKNKRPLACGDISIPLGLLTLTGLIFLAAIMIIFRMQSSLDIFALYIVLNLLYTFRLKRDAPYDLFLLAYFYNIRLMVGGAATGIELSLWLQTFSLFFFLSLGVIKRYSEVYYLYNHEGRYAIKGRGYNAKDLPFLSVFGVGSGLISIMVLSLYLFQKELPVDYSNTQILWFLPVVLLIWLTNMWLKTTRGVRIEEPVKYIFKDSMSFILFTLMGLIFISSI